MKTKNWDTWVEFCEDINPSTRWVLERSDNVLWALTPDKSKVVGQYNFEAQFGWYFERPINWDHRYRKLEEIKFQPR